MSSARLRRSRVSRTKKTLAFSMTFQVFCALSVGFCAHPAGPLFWSDPVQVIRRTFLAEVIGRSQGSLIT
jgi:hypothetical protein